MTSYRHMRVEVAAINNITFVSLHSKVLFDGNKFETWFPRHIIDQRGM
jgi:hypothetical protein